MKTVANSTVVALSLLALFTPALSAEEQVEVLLMRPLSLQPCEENNESYQTWSLFKP